MDIDNVEGHAYPVRASIDKAVSTLHKFTMVDANKTYHDDERSNETLVSRGTALWPLCAPIGWPSHEHSTM